MYIEECFPTISKVRIMISHNILYCFTYHTPYVRTTAEDDDVIQIKYIFIHALTQRAEHGGPAGVYTFRYNIIITVVLVIRFRASCP